MAISGRIGMLSFTKLGDKTWTDVEMPTQLYKSVVYYKDKFYVVGGRGMYACEINYDQPPEATLIARTPYSVVKNSTSYLVESSDELLLVCRHSHYAPKPTMTTSCDVLRLEIEKEGEYKLVNVDGLGNRAIFIGHNASSSFPTLGVVDGCKGDNKNFTTNARNINNYTSHLGYF
ncbi:hypothetical protein ACFE04_029814 [Oxalis oulophora]